MHDAVRPLLNKGVSTGLAAAWRGTRIARRIDDVHVAAVKQRPLGIPGGRLDHSHAASKLTRSDSNFPDKPHANPPSKLHLHLSALWQALRRSSHIASAARPLELSLLAHRDRAGPRAC